MLYKNISKWAIRLVKILEIILSFLIKLRIVLMETLKKKIELTKQGSTELINAAKEIQNNFKNTLKGADKTISKINSYFSSLMKNIVSALIAFVFIEAIFFFGYMFYDSHKTNEARSALQSSLDKALYDVSNLKGFIIHIYNQDSQKASEDFTKWLSKNGDSNVW